MLTTEQIETMIAEAMPNVLEALKRELASTAEREAANLVRSKVQEAITNTVTEHIVPDLAKAIIESKEGLINIAPTLAQGVCNLLAEAMTDTLKKKLESSWERQQLFQALFK